MIDVTLTFLTHLQLYKSEFFHVFILCESYYKKTKLTHMFV